MIIYQVLTRLFGSGKFSAFDTRTFEWMKEMGISHVWYTGIPRHSFGKSYVKGDIGSPYSIVDWYDVNPYLADNEDERMGEFEQLIKRTHDAGLKVIIDFIPNHVSPDYSDAHGGIPTLGHCDYDWTDTDKVDYSSRTTWKAMEDILSFWCSKGVDGFRCDMVELVPVAFFHELTNHIKAAYPGTIFIGECYEFHNYGPYLQNGGFDFLYDKSGMYDTLRGVISGQRLAWDITGNWQRLGWMQPRMLNFLENHDEQRLASPWFAGSAQRGYCALAVSALFYPAPWMLYFGQELGESASDGHEGRTSIFSQARHIDPLGALSEQQMEVMGRYRQVMKLAREFEGAANFDLCYFQKGELGFDMRRHFAFLRHDCEYDEFGVAVPGSQRCILVVCNFSSTPARMMVRIPAEAPQLLGSEVELDIAPWDFTILRK